MTTAPQRSVPAPELREVAQIWWDLDREPAITWDAGGRHFHLVDPQSPEDADRRILLAELAVATTEAREVALALASGLASCDFPPTEGRASVSRVAATLRVAGRTERPVAG